jgi:DNA-binding transcriptional regulator YhcF (GntR family)
MDIKISKSFPLGIKEQLTRQLTAMIETGSLEHGALLLSAKDLAAYLSINRNTVAAVYKTLEQHGYLKVVKGSGTYVRTSPTFKASGELTQIFESAFELALKRGFTHHQICNHFVTGLLKKELGPEKAKKVVLIDCNYEVLETLDQQIKQEIDIESHCMLIQDIESQPGRFLKRARNYDLVLCGMNHMEALKDAVKEVPVETIGFMIKTDFSLISHLSRLPANSSVGFCCLTEKSSRAVFKTTILSTGINLNCLHAGIRDKKQIRQMINSCSAIFATHYVYENLVSDDTLISNDTLIPDNTLASNDAFVNSFPVPKTIHKVDLTIDKDNLEYIINRLKQ